MKSVFAIRWLALLTSVAMTSWGCARATATDSRALRLGFLPNFTHAQALVGVTEGVFARALAPVPLESMSFHAGSAAMEALLAGELDVCYVGSGPALNAYVRSDHAIQVIAGAASGGAVLVTRHARSPAQLDGRTLGAPQLGNSQDVALRTWLRSHGVQAQVITLSNSEIFGLFLRGRLDGAWVPEPWGSRLRAEAGGTILVDERDLWPERRFPTTVLVATRRAIELRRGDVLALVRAHVALTREAQGDPSGFAERSGRAFANLTGRALAAPIVEEAFSRLEMSEKILGPELAQAAQSAHALGYLPSAEVSGLSDPTLLDEASRSEPGGTEPALGPAAVPDQPSR